MDEVFGFLILLLFLFCSFMIGVIVRPNPYTREGERNCYIKCDSLKSKPIEISNTYYCLCENGKQFKRNTEFYIPMESK